MARSLTLAAHHDAAYLLRRYRSTPDRVERAHWQVIYLKSQAHSTRHISQIVGYSEDWVLKIIHRYNDRGPDALADRRHRHPGAPPMLDRQQQADLDAALATGCAGDGGPWTGPKVARWIEQATGRAHVHEQRGWEWLVRLGFSSQTPRPHHDGADMAAQAAFKKHARAGGGGAPADACG